MSSGVVSIRCPACGRPFISLPQQPEALVSCPHCTQSAPMAEYSPASTAPNPTVFSERLRMLQVAEIDEDEESESAYEDEFVSSIDSTEVVAPVPTPTVTASVDTTPLAPSDGSDGQESEPEVGTAGITEMLQDQPPAPSDVSSRDWTKWTLSLILLTLLGIVCWLLWEQLQPALRVDIPVVAPPTMSH